jgi:hypothetical protein
MKLMLSLALLCLILFQTGCTLGPSNEQQSRTSVQEQETVKRSDAFAHDLRQ